MATDTATRLGPARALRIAAFLAGATIIGAVTAGNVMALGGLWSPTAATLITHAAGLVVGAMCVGIAWGHRRRALAVLLGATLLAGEAYTLVNTAERELDAREARQIPKRETADRRAQLQAQIGKGEAALATIRTSWRLDKALEVQARIETNAIATSAAPKCGRVCGLTLAESKASAQREVDAARAALGVDRQGLLARLAADKAALIAIPAMAALSPLAARVGVADWLLDLIRAALFTVSANGLGAALLAFSAHTPVQRTAAPSIADTAQTSFALDPPPGGPGKRRRQRSGLPATVTPKHLPENVISLAGKRSEIVSALEVLGRPASVSELARRMGVSVGEASRRWREAGALVEASRRGKFVLVALRSARAA